jgi:hypothetical protein
MIFEVLKWFLFIIAKVYFFFNMNL